MSLSDDNRLNAPATQRNREPILEVLKRVLPGSGTILEVASGTGEHAVFFAPALPQHNWLPSDPDPQYRASIAAWRKYVAADNLYEPIELDARSPVWSVEADLQSTPIAAIVCINMIHIAPWSACLGLMAGAGRILPSGGILFLYGPFKQNYQHTAPSNAAFDESLRYQNPEWGVRDFEEVLAAAKAHHLNWIETVQMPANNLSVVFQRS